MFKKIVMSLFFCSAVVSFESVARPNAVDKLISTPLRMAQQKGSTAITITPEGKAIVLNAGSGEAIKPCPKGKGKSKHFKEKFKCNANLVNASKKVLDLIQSTEKVHKVEVLKNGQMVPAQLTFIAAITYKSPVLDLKGKAKKAGFSLLDTIISTASADTVQEYCTVIYSGGNAIETCISLGNDCKLWKDAYGEAVVLSLLPECAPFF